MKCKNLWDLIVDVSMGYTDKEVKKKEMVSFKSNLAECQRFIDQEISLEVDNGAWIIHVFSADNPESITLKIPCDRWKPLELTEIKQFTKMNKYKYDSTTSTTTSP